MIEVAPLLPPSTALRRGTAIVDRQLFEAYFGIVDRDGRVIAADVDDGKPSLGKGEKICACAVGAIAIGWGLQDGETASDDIDTFARKHFGSNEFANPAAPNEYPMSLSSTIIRLNDTHKWPLEKIADWLEGLGA